MGAAEEGNLGGGLMPAEGTGTSAVGAQSAPSLGDTMPRLLCTGLVGIPAEGPFELEESIESWS